MTSALASIRGLQMAMVIAILMLAPRSAAQTAWAVQTAREACPIVAPHIPVDDKWLYFVMAAHAAQDDEAYRAHVAAVEAVKAVALQKRPLAKVWASFARVEVDAAGNVIVATGLIGKSPFRKSKQAPENAVLASILASIGQPGIGSLQWLHGVDGSSQSAESRAEGEWASSAQTLPAGVACPHCRLFVRFDKENEQVVEVRNDLVTITNDLYQKPNFNVAIARAVVWDIFQNQTSTAAPMMALRDPYGKGRLVWGVFIPRRCVVGERNISSRRLSYAMDPRSYAIVGIFANPYAVFEAIPGGPSCFPSVP